jgi:hypothetical protein
MKNRVLGLTLAFAFVTAFGLSFGFTADAQFVPLSYSKIAVGYPMASACANAVEAIEDACALHGPITTQGLGCWPLFGLDGEIIGHVCRCKATTTFCANPLPFP